jgi:hypothetical protein
MKYCVSPTIMALACGMALVTSGCGSSGGGSTPLIPTSVATVPTTGTGTGPSAVAEPTVAGTWSGSYEVSSGVARFDLRRTALNALAVGSLGTEDRAAATSRRVVFRVTFKQDAAGNVTGTFNDDDGFSGPLTGAVVKGKLSFTVGFTASTSPLSGTERQGRLQFRNADVSAGRGLGLAGEVEEDLTERAAGATTATTRKGSGFAEAGGRQVPAEDDAGVASDPVKGIWLVLGSGAQAQHGEVLNLRSEYGQNLVYSLSGARRGTWSLSSATPAVLSITIERNQAQRVTARTYSGPFNPGTQVVAATLTFDDNNDGVLDPATSHNLMMVRMPAAFAPMPIVTAAGSALPVAFPTLPAGLPFVPDTAGDVSGDGSAADLTSLRAVGLRLGTDVGLGLRAVTLNTPAADDGIEIRISGPDWRQLTLYQDAGQGPAWSAYAQGAGGTFTTITGTSGIQVTPAAQGAGWDVIIPRQALEAAGLVGPLGVWARAKVYKGPRVSPTSASSDGTRRLHLMLPAGNAIGSDPQIPTGTGTGTTSTQDQIEAANLTRASFEGILTDGTTDFAAVALQAANALAKDPQAHGAQVTKALAGFLAWSTDQARPGGKLRTILDQYQGTLKKADGSVFSPGTDKPSTLADVVFAALPASEGAVPAGVPTAATYFGFLDQDLRAQLLALDEGLGRVPGDFSYRVTIDALHGLIADPLTASLQQRQVDIGDIAALRAGLHLTLAAIDILHAYQHGNADPNAFDGLTDQQVFSLLDGTYVAMGTLAADAQARLGAARGRIASAASLYQQAAAWIRAETPDQQSLGLITLGRDTFDSPADRSRIETSEAALRAQLVDTVAKLGGIKLFDTDENGQPLPADQRVEIDFGKLFAGVDLRSRYYRTVTVDGTRRLGVSSVDDYTLDQVTAGGVLRQLRGTVPTAKNGQELLGFLPVHATAIASGTPTLDGSFSEWGSATVLWTRPERWLSTGADRQIGGVSAMKDATNLYLAVRVAQPAAAKTLLSEWYSHSRQQNSAATGWTYTYTNRQTIDGTVYELNSMTPAQIMAMNEATMPKFIDAFLGFGNPRLQLHQGSRVNIHSGATYDYAYSYTYSPNTLPWPDYDYSSTSTSTSTYAFGLNYQMSNPAAPALITGQSRIDGTGKQQDLANQTWPPTVASNQIVGRATTGGWEIAIPLAWIEAGVVPLNLGFADALDTTGGGKGQLDLPTILIKVKDAPAPASAGSRSVGDAIGHLSRIAR